MAQTTGIEWADATHNPWYGCEKVSPACAHCYAEREMTRYGRDFGKVTRAKDATFYAPLKWKEPRRIFTCSWSDFFIEEADAWRQDAWSVIEKTPRHTYMILTKRPHRSFIEAGPWFDNIWLGASVENEHFYGRINHLLFRPAKIRFLSIEPMLGPMPALPLEDIHWVIVGTESGPNPRPTSLDWIRNLRDQCKMQGVAFFVKQLTTPGGRKIPWEDWPEDLRVRELPAEGRP